MAYRAVLFWISLAYKLFMFSLVVTIGFWIYNRGPEGFMDDVGNMGNYWMAQYEKFSDEVNYYQSQKEEHIHRQQNRGWW
jgi:hypothetical protein